LARILIFAFALLLASLSEGQDNRIIEKIPMAPNMILQVKQLDEFIGRFNYSQDIFGNPISDPFRKKISREEYIESLFDNQDPRLDGNSAEFDPLYTQRITRFISEVIDPDNPKYLDLDSKLIFAVASSIFIQNKQEITIELVLNKEVSDRMSKWVIAGVRKDLPGSGSMPANDSTISIIPPTSNETNFIALNRVFEDTAHIPDFFHSDFIRDNLSLLEYKIATHDLRFKGVESITYHILDIPGWVIVVRNFNRDSMNSGWLISDLIRLDNGVKPYLRDTLGINFGFKLSG